MAEATPLTIEDGELLDSITERLSRAFDSHEEGKITNVQAKKITAAANKEIRAIRKRLKERHIESGTGAS